MTRYSGTWLVLAALAVLQALSAAVLLAWAWPLFADPPLLLNGVRSRARALEALVTSAADAPRLLDGMSTHYVWLFWRHAEGVQAALVAAAALSASALVTLALLLAARPPAPARAA